MADYFGLTEIAKRMAIATSTLKRWQLERSFPIYRRGGRGLRGRAWRWYSNDDLIRLWELEQARRDRQTVKARIERQHATRNGA